MLGNNFLLSIIVNYEDIYTFNVRNICDDKLQQFNCSFFSDWNVFRDQNTEEETFRKQIIRWFGDFPTEQSPFSIHHLVEIGKKLGKDPGDWYGPSSVAHIMR